MIQKKTNYRSLAKGSLDRATQMLESKDDSLLRYVCLELRMAIESLIYDRASRYSDELPAKSIQHWQPKQLLEQLLEISPYADGNYRLSLVSSDRPFSESKPLGRGRGISLAELKKYHQALGSRLHPPTIAQEAEHFESNVPKLRATCLDVKNIICAVLEAPTIHFDAKEMVSIACGQCGSMIARRAPRLNQTIEVKCLHCQASYELANKEENQVSWIPVMQNVDCIRPNCGGTSPIWKREAVVGFTWTCPKCGDGYRLRLGMEPDVNTAGNNSVG